MMKIQTAFYSVLALIILALPGCDTGGGVVAGIDRGGVTGGAVGTITGFGSVIVNGVHYTTTSANIVVNGVAATEVDLEVGYFVVIQAEFPDDGSAPAATSIEFGHDAIGPLTSVDVAQNQVVVLGQTVSIDDRTIFGPGIVPASVDGLAALPTMQTIRISGLPGTSTTLLATRIELGEAGADLEVTGIVSSLDANAKTLEIGGQVIDYGSANLEGFDGGQPAVGDRIEATGDRFTIEGALVAQQLQRKEIELPLEDGDELEIEGLITSFTSAASFSVSGVRVTTGSQTTFENGDAGMLGLDVRVEVEGSIDGNGILVADEVEFRQSAAARVAAIVETTDTGAGTLDLLGIMVRTDSTTSFEDQSPAELQSFHLQDINPGESLSIVGVEEATGTLLATQILRTEPLEKLVLRGVATDVLDPQLTLLGVTVLADDQTDVEDDFFATAEGRIVEVTGGMTTGSFLAEKIETTD